MSKQILVTLISLLFSGQIMAIEEPKYEVLEVAGDFELRAYNPMIVAENHC